MTNCRWHHDRPPVLLSRGRFYSNFGGATMLDINIIREQPDVVRKALADRQMETASVEQILELDHQRRLTIQEAENLKAQRNAVSKEISKARDPTERQAKIEAMRQVGERISQLDEALRKTEDEVNGIPAGIPT